MSFPPGLSCKGKTTAQFLIFVPLMLLVLLAGCMQPKEKTFTGTSTGELELSYTATLKLITGKDEASYLLQLKPLVPEKFIAALNDKWHGAGKIKLDAYNQMKKYCEMTKDPVACASLQEFSQEVANPVVAISLNLILSADDGQILETINFNQNYNLDEKDTIAVNNVTIDNKLKISAKNFARINRAELRVGL